jgi:hypothetical protein
LLFGLFGFYRLALASNELAMAARTFFPIATDMVIVAWQHRAIMTARRIANQDSMVILVWCGRLVLMRAFSSIRNRVQVPVYGFNRHFDAAIRLVHLLLAVFANGHSVDAPKTNPASSGFPSAAKAALDIAVGDPG